MNTATTPTPSMFAVFRRRDFSLLWLAQLISTAGSSLTDLAAGIWVYRETESALAVGLTLMATAVPSLFVGLLAGVLSRAVEKGYLSKNPVKETFGQWSSLRLVLIALIGVTAGQGATYFTGQFYVMIFLQQAAQIDQKTVYEMVVLGFIIGAPRPGGGSMRALVMSSTSSSMRAS